MSATDCRKMFSLFSVFSVFSYLGLKKHVKRLGVR